MIGLIKYITDEGYAKAYNIGYYIAWINGCTRFRASRFARIYAEDYVKSVLEGRAKVIEKVRALAQKLKQEGKFHLLKDALLYEDDSKLETLFTEYGIEEA